MLRTPNIVTALAALAAVTVVMTAFWAATGLLRRRAVAVLSCACALVVLAIPLLETLWPLVVAWLLVAAIGVATLVVASRGRLHLRPSHRAVIAMGSLLAGFLAYSLSWQSIDVWGWATLASVILLLCSRWAVDERTQVPRATLLALAIAISLVGAAALAQQLSASTVGWQPAVDALHFVGIAATALLALAFLAARRLSARPVAVYSRLDIRVAFWSSGVTALVVSGASMATLFGMAPSDVHSGLLLPEFETSLVLAIALLGVLAAWSFGVSTRTMTPERAVAALAIAPTTYWMVDAFTRVVSAQAGARAITPVISALLVAGASLAVTTRASGAPPRWLREISTVLIAVPGAIIAAVTTPGYAWLILLIAAVTSLVLAASKDGLFGSGSRRRYLGWLALALATAGLWSRLGDAHIVAVEAYVLPLAGVLLGLSALIWISGVKRSTHSVIAPYLTLAGLLVAILPIAIDITANTGVRAAIVGGASALLLLIACYSRCRVELRPFLDAAVLAGALEVLITALLRGLALVTVPGGSQDFRLELWIGTAAAVLVAAAVGFARADTPATPWRRRASTVLVLVALTTVLGFELWSVNATGLGLTRAFTSLVLFLAVYLVCAIWNHPPFPRTLGWAALGFAAVMVIRGVGAGALDPLELGTVPVALAMLADGTTRMSENQRMRSWPHLGPALTVLLIPSLISTIDERPLWRLVALGVVSVAVLVVGATRKLQAPFVLGVVVALIHGIASLSREIRRVYEALPWWLWLGIGGILLIVLAARYEQRIKNFTSVATRIASLR